MYWRKPGGYTEIKNRTDMPIYNNGHTVLGWQVHEMHSFTCCHCNRVTFVESGKHLDIGRCTCCNDLICDKCIGHPCLPLMKRLDLYERGKLRKLDSGYPSQTLKDKAIAWLWRTLGQ